MNLRKLARGQECQVRIYGICNRDNSSVCLCHIRRGGVAGVGIKPHDIIGVWACSACHDAIDGRDGGTPRDHDSDLLDGLCRTLAIVSKHLD